MNRDLARMTMPELQRFGMEHPADLGYRVEIASRCADHVSASRLVTFDDVAMGVPEAQRHLLHGLPGYERALLATLWQAPGYPEGGATLVAAPPNPAEREWVIAAKRSIEQQLRRSIRFEVLYEHGGRLIDLLGLTPGVYEGLCLEYAERVGNLDVDEWDALYHAKLAIHHGLALFGNGRTHVIPFQVTADHTELFADYLAHGQVVLPDIPDMNKAYHNLFLRERGFHHIPVLTAVVADGQTVSTSHDLLQRMQAMRSHPLPPTRDNLYRYAEGLIAALDAFPGQAMIKADADGVSGLANVSRTRYPGIYDHTANRETRIQSLAELIDEALAGMHLPAAGVIEEFINAGMIEGVAQDYVVCGLAIDGYFMTTSISPFGTTDGNYDRQWTAPDATGLNEDPVLWQSMAQAYIDMCALTSDMGYRNGIYAGDMFARPLGAGYKLDHHDANHRRGGRSTSEGLLAVRPHGWFEGQVEVDLSAYSLSVADRYHLYTEVCRSMVRQGIYPNSTSFGYFGRSPDGHTFLKVKLLVPITMVYPAGGSPVSRKDQLDWLRTRVEATVHTLTS